MGTEYKEITNTRSNDTVKTISIKQFAGGQDFDGLAIQLTTNTEESQRGGDLLTDTLYRDFFQALQISRQDIPAIVDALQKYYDGEYPTQLQYEYEQSHFKGTCACQCTEDDEIYEM